MASPAELEALKAEILSLTRRYAASAHRAFRPAGDPLRPAFDSKGGSIPYAGRVFTEDEVEAAVSNAYVGLTRNANTIKGATRFTPERFIVNVAPDGQQKVSCILTNADFLWNYRIRV